MAESEKKDTQRRRPRKTALLTGRIIYHNATCTAPCRITDVSEDGAGIRLADLIDLPKTFDLEFFGGPTRSCRVRWRRGIRLGISFE